LRSKAKGAVLSDKQTQGAVLLIGAGRMGSALVKGWIAGGAFSSIHIVEPNPSPELARLADGKQVRLHGAFGGAVPEVAAIVLAIKPQVLKGAQELLAALGKRDALVLSIAAGVTSAFLRGGLGGNGRVVRAMPNTPGAIGRGISVLYGDASLSAADRARAETLMAALGETLWIGDESQMDAVTAVSGSGPAYIFLLVEAMAAAARAQGLEPATAEKLARATVAGAGALLDADGRGADRLRQEVTSPGGTTEAALNVLMAKDGLEELMTRAIAAATQRGKELGK
jgi:pyrroline-5-carboxylate reductase